MLFKFHKKYVWMFKSLPYSVDNWQKLFRNMKLTKGLCQSFFHSYTKYNDILLLTSIILVEGLFTDTATDSYTLLPSWNFHECTSM